MRAPVGLLLAALLALGCGEDDRPPVLGNRTGPPTVPGHHARSVEGTTGVPITVSPLLGIFTVPVQVGGASGPPMLIDTGSPVTFVDPGSFGQAAREGTAGVATLATGSTTLVDVPVVWADPFNVSPLIGGVLGVNLICQFTSTWDWQRGRFVLGAVPTDVELTGEARRQSFALVGGGYLATADGSSIPVPATRLLVEAQVESRTFHLVLDTGASTTALRDDVVDAFTSDGRGTLSVAITAQGGAMRQRYFRVRRLGALGVSREGVTVVGYSAAILASISSEVGVAVDGLLGAEFLRPWLTTIDYPAHEVVLRPYRDASHVRDAMVRAGVLLGVTGTGAVLVSQVAPESDAADHGFAAGERLVSVDGRAVSGMTRDEADLLLLGAVGDTRHVVTDQREADVRVEDLLRLP